MGNASLIELRLQECEQGYIDRQMNNLKYALEQNGKCIDYISQWTVLHLPSATAKNVKVKLFDEYQEIPSFMTPEGERKFVLDCSFPTVWHMILYVDEDILGYVSMEFEDDSMILYDMRNFRPDEFKNVGTVIMKEVVYTIVTDPMSNNPLLGHEFGEHFLRKGLLRCRSITLRAVFQALLFYEKMGFEFVEPEKRIPIYPHVPNYEHDLLRLEDGDDSPGTIYDYPERSKEAWPKPCPGIYNRFKIGKPTDLDFRILEDYIIQMGGDITFHYRPCYKQFIQDNPGLDDYLSDSVWKLPAKEVLNREKVRFQNTKKKYIGTDCQILMKLNFDLFKKRFPVNQ